MADEKETNTGGRTLKVHHLRPAPGARTVSRPRPATRVAG